MRTRYRTRATLPHVPAYGQAAGYSGGPFLNSLGPHWLTPPVKSRREVARAKWNSSVDQGRCEAHLLR